MFFTVSQKYYQILATILQGYTVRERATLILVRILLRARLTPSSIRSWALQQDQAIRSTRLAMYTLYGPSTPPRPKWYDRLSWSYQQMIAQALRQAPERTPAEGEHELLDQDDEVAVCGTCRSFGLSFLMIRCQECNDWFHPRPSCIQRLHYEDGEPCQFCHSCLTKMTSDDGWLQVIDGTLLQRDEDTWGLSLADSDSNLAD